MNRRRLLIGAGTLLSNATAGCLERISTGNDSTREGNDSMSNADEQTYEKCSLSIIAISSLPEPAENEATTALEDGVYESEDSLILEEIMDTDESYLEHEGEYYRYYEPVIDTEDGTTTLRLTEAYPETNRSLTIVNESDEQRTITLRLVLSDETVFEDEFTLESDKESTIDDEVNWRLGVYRVEVETKTISEEADLGVDDFGDGYFLEVDDEGISVGGGGEDAVDPNRCTWDDEGNVDTRW